MPLFLLLALGMLQLSLMHQARLVAKYAAYKAARVGSIHSAKMSAMSRAASGVLLPVTGRARVDSFYSASPNNYAASWAAAQLASAIYDPVKVTICEPKSGVSGDFDDPAGGLGAFPTNGNALDFQTFTRGRLAIQVTFMYQMVIPFANMVLWHIVAGQEDYETMRTLRMNRNTNRPTQSFSGAGTIVNTNGLARTGHYYMPIRAGWAMRMQSNFVTGQDFRLPASNLCKVSFL